MGMKKASRIRLVALALFLAGVACLFCLKMSQSFVSQMTVAEALQNTTTPERRTRLSGVVGSDGLTFPGPNRQTTFTLLDKDIPDAGVIVNCRGLIPDGISPGTEIFAEGFFTDSPPAFQADKLIVRCASHYQ